MKITKFGQEARDSVKRGIDLVADAVKITLGPTGRNAILGRQNIPPIITNDGITIARNIEAQDEIENLGVGIMQEALSVADSNGGDGTTTTAVILQALTHGIFESMKPDGSFIHKGIDTIKIKKDIDEWCDKVVSKLKESSRKITKKDFYNVALVSGEYKELAKIISEVYEKIGNDGYVSVEDGVRSEFEIFKGIELNAGYTSDYFITDTEKRQCIIESPRILITNHRIDEEAVSTLLTLISGLADKGIKDLLIIAPDFSRDILARFSTTKLKANFSAIALKIPTFDRDDILIDIATLTKGKLIDKKLYTKLSDLLQDFTIDNLGKADQAIIGDSKSIIIGGEGDTKGRVKELKKIKEKTDSVFDKDAIDKRIAYLSGGIGVIKIGGVSDFERTYFKLKCEDAINAVDMAIKHGVVKGGGIALKEISESLPKNILTNALCAPYDQIQFNSGGIVIEDSIIDATQIVISSLKAACSLAGLVITTDVAVAYKSIDYATKNKDEN